MDELEEEFYCHSKVNGTTFREKEMGGPLPWNDLRRGRYLILSREPTNEHDPNAIKVFFAKGRVSTHIGYIPKNTAETLAKLMDDGKLKFYARISEITGGTDDKTNRGINISIYYKKIGKE